MTKEQPDKCPECGERYWFVLDSLGGYVKRLNHNCPSTGEKPEFEDEKTDIDKLAKEFTLVRLAEWIAIEHNETTLEFEKYIEEAQGLMDLLYVIGYRLTGGKKPNEEVEK